MTLDIFKKIADGSTTEFAYQKASKENSHLAELEIIKEEKELFKATLLSIGEGILATDKNNVITVINEVAQNLTGWTKEEAIGLKLNKVFNIVNEKTGKVYDNSVWQILGTDKLTAIARHNLLISKDGTTRPIMVNASPIIDEDGKIQGVVWVFRDVTLEKEKIDNIEYLSYHDPLTGLYNRSFYEEELFRLNTKRNLPLTIVMADLNGLKLINDAFGHDMGDHLLQKAAEIIRTCCRTDDIIARIGGDEFLILLPKTDSQDTEKLVERIKEKCSKTYIGLLTLSISFGWETKTLNKEPINEIQRNAEDKMYRNKLFEGPHIRESTLSAIIQTLFEAHPPEETHSRRVSKICKELATELGFNDRELEDIEHAALLHDIGKIALDTHILNKIDSLTLKEKKEIQRHPEIGYRILSAINDLSHTADSVLAHHERWDGNGYPKGLKGNQIPTLARIISLSEAYDAIICDKPYRSALSKKEALEQICMNSGTQFDPDLVKLFLHLYSDKPEI